MIRNILMSTFLSLKAHKLRVFLTMLGIIIGIASVVTIAALGEGIRQQTISLADSTNSNEVKIQYVMPMSEDPTYYEESTFAFSRVDMKRVQKATGVTSILPDYGEGMGMGSSVEIISADFNYFGQQSSLQLTPYSEDHTILYGRNLTAADANHDVIVLSHDVFDYGIIIDNPEDMIGQAISLNGYMYQVVGIKTPYDYDNTPLTGGGDDYLTASSSIVPRSSYNDLTKYKPIVGLKIKFDGSSDRYAATEEIIQELVETYPDEQGTFEEDRSNEEMQQEMETYMAGIVNFLMAITAISLLVGGIGVMNIMYVSVTERKREIGIRRAIGAKPRTILFQFILEAAFITFIGGLLGLVSGYGIAILAGSFMDLEPVLTMQTILLSTSVSVLTGLFFGIMPAVNAAKMDPIKAIYH
ncbi:putative ABC transport system permease protein [Carnobacterium iners]|uniref:Putative ABC transport system permease protein n=1 Tax=Carnobacterium iners TaxID=1073423 RepID=A0A1X7NAL3_9LACT|nr:FtsX-like permease family protein [Carnobacterium iners]SEK51758.1 putative ABC transport system permease protein [Carnobacterium iners]SMH34647.1 putative ABC transport system permease protein [Carnobacterium iners]